MTYETDAVFMALRAKARAELAILDQSCRDFYDSLTEGQKLELGRWLADGRALLHGNEAPPADAPPKNVKRLFMVGRRGPAFGESMFEIAAGGAAVRCTTARDHVASAQEEPESDPPGGERGGA